MKTALFRYLVTAMLAFAVAPLQAQPSINLDPPTIEYDLYTGQRTEFVINLVNNGDEILNWRIEIAYRAAPEGWLRIDPLNGNVGSGEDMDVRFTLDATGLPGGNDEAEAHFISNDPEHPDMMVDALLHVHPAPNIEVVWSEAAGYPNSINFNQNGFVWVGAINEIPFIIRNTGFANLHIDSIRCLDNQFLAEPDRLVIESDDEHNITLTFTTDMRGLYETVLSIYCDDLDEPEVDIFVRAEALLPPHMVVGADSIDTHVEDGAGRSEFTISNRGASPLNWDATLDQIDGPPVDTTTTRLTVEPSSGAISPDSSQQVSIVANIQLDGWFKLLFDLVIRSNDPGMSEVVIPVRVSGNEQFSVTSEMQPPVSMLLASVYPNPFNSSSTIRFLTGAINRRATTLRVYNLAGRFVEELLNGRLEAGEHSVVWNATGLPGGVYLIRLESSGKQAISKVVLMK